MNRLHLVKTFSRHQSFNAVVQLLRRKLSSGRYCSVNCFILNEQRGIPYKSKEHIPKHNFYKIRLHSNAKKGEFEVHQTVKQHELLQNVIQKKKKELLDKRDVFVKDIRDTKTRVKEKMEEVIERENVFTIPNLLCVGRAILAPYLGYVIIQGDYGFALGLLAAAGFSDLLDGWIARTWTGQASKMGSFLDPMADKLLVGALFISLTYCQLLPLWLTATVLTRDVLLVGAGFVIRYRSLPPPRTFTRYFDVTHATAQLAPTLISKINTGVQLLLVATALGAPLGNYVDHPALQGLCVVTGITTVAAAISYLTSRNTYKMLKKNPTKQL